MTANLRQRLFQPCFLTHAGGRVILSKSSDEISHSSLASRIMTVLITIERADIEAMVTASKDAVNTKGATLNLTVGEKYAVKIFLCAVTRFIGCRHRHCRTRGWEAKKVLSN